MKDIVHSNFLSSCLSGQKAKIVLTIAFSVAVLSHVYSYASRMGKITIEMKDCSYDRSGKKPTPYWKEEKFMNCSKRAKWAVNILTRRIKLRPGGAIVDMGSGYQQVRSYVPKRSRYIPVDIENRVPGSSTVICNLNEREFPFLRREKIDAFLFLGSFEYVYDKVTVLRLCRKRNAPVVLLYNFRGMTQEKFAWVAPLSPPVLREAARSVGYSTEFINTRTLQPFRQDTNLASQTFAMVLMRPI